MVEAKNKKLNILFVRFGTTAGIIGGGVTRLLEINRCLREQANFFMVTHKATFEWLKSLGLKAEAYFLERTGWTWRQDIIEIAYCGVAAFLFLKKKKGVVIDWVYSFTNTLPDLLPALRAKYLTGAKLAVYIQLTVFPRKGEKRDPINFVLVFLDRLVTFGLMKKWADVVFVFNAPDKEELIRRGIDARRIRILNYGVDLEYIRAVKDMPKKYDGVFLGRLTPGKGYMELPDIWKQVCLRLPEARLAVIGSSMSFMEKKLKDKVSELGMSERISILGSLYGKDKYEVIRSSRVLLNPSYLESWCIAICEALACGVPVAAYDLDVYAGIYNGSITVARKGDIKGFADNVTALLTDPDLYQRQKIKGLEVCQRYDWKQSARQELEYLMGGIDVWKNPQ